MKFYNLYLINNNFDSTTFVCRCCLISTVINSKGTQYQIEWFSVSAFQWVSGWVGGVQSKARPIERNLQVGRKDRKASIA